MSHTLEYWIDGYQYITRKQISEVYPITYFDTQRWVEKHRNNKEIECKQYGKVIYYRLVDVERIFRIQKLRTFREEVLVKARSINQSA